MKRYLTSICFFTIPLVTLIETVWQWFGFRWHGLLTWSLCFGLLLLGAYFTKYLKTKED